MFLQSVSVQMFFEKAVVALVKFNTMIVDTPCYIYQMVQRSHALRTVSSLHSPLLRAFLPFDILFDYFKWSIADCRNGIRISPKGRQPGT